jgi:UDP-glucose 4-epimerase
LATVLVTGGAGYIGTHILTVLAAHGHESVCVDNYANSSPRALDRVGEITGRSVHAYDVDIRDAAGLEAVLARHEVDSVIHMAGLKAVGESVQFPGRYHDNNVGGTRTLLEALAASSVRKFVFSSSATVYGMADRMPIAEDAPTAPTSPYGENKLEIEGMLASLAARDPSWRVVNLRYFNPVGAHPSGRIGEDPAGIPNNLMPFVCQVAAGRLSALQVFGNDYPTKDGTGVRDYIHVMDLAEGHVAALEAMAGVAAGTVMTVNLGTGRGTSVLELVESFEKVNGVAIPRKFTARREGDVAVCYADASLAKAALRWAARLGIDEMCRDAWHWQKNNPMGYSQREAK